MINILPPIPAFFGGWGRVIVWATCAWALIKTKLESKINPSFVNYCDTVKVQPVQNF